MALQKKLGYTADVDVFWLGYKCKYSYFFFFFNCFTNLSAANKDVPGSFNKLLHSDENLCDESSLRWIQLRTLCSFSFVTSRWHEAAELKRSGVRGQLAPAHAIWPLSFTSTLTYILLTVASASAAPVSTRKDRVFLQFNMNKIESELFEVSHGYNSVYSSIFNCCYTKMYQIYKSSSFWCVV